jgi:hypothetical protein
MFGFKKMALLAPVAALALIAAPASAAGVGGGVVDGAVSVSPGIPAMGTNANNVTFTSTVLIGAITVGASAYVGAINCSATGSGTDSAAMGAGNVTVNCNTGSPAVGTVTCNFTGPYTRAGAVVVVQLTGSCTVNGTAGTASVTVAALFIPSSTSGTTVTGAIFAGVWAGTTA